MLFDRENPCFDFKISSSTGTKPITLLSGLFFSRDGYWSFSHLHQSNYTISAELVNYYIEKNINGSVVRQENVKAKLNKGTKLLNQIINPHTQFSE